MGTEAVYVMNLTTYEREHLQSFKANKAWNSRRLHQSASRTERTEEANSKTDPPHLESR